MLRSNLALLAAAQKLDLSTALRQIPSGQWKADPSGRDAITRPYSFVDYNTCWAFMNAVTPHIVKMDHHPEWWNCYGTLKVVLATHTCNGVSSYDVELANYMDQVAVAFSAK